MPAEYDLSRSRRDVLEAGITGVALGLGGCLRFSGESQSSGDGGDAADTASQTTTTVVGTLSSDEYPPGVTEDGVQEPQQLVEATRSALLENSYDISSVLVQGSSANEITQRVQSSPEQQRHSLTFDAPSETNVLYAEPDTTYIKSTSEGETEYRKQPTEASIADLHDSADIVELLGDGEALGGIVDGGEFVPARLDAYNGRRVVRFDFQGVDTSEMEAEVTDSTGRMVATPDGVVFDAALGLTATEEGESREFENTVTVDGLGSVQVPRPSWVDEQF
jgi:hypothetical protein